MRCEQCGAPHSAAALFCSTCGFRVRENDIVECDTHSMIEATGVCVICGRPVCDDCAVTRDGKVFCDDARHAELAATHESIAYVSSEAEGEIVAKNLASGGIPALLFSAKRYSHFCQLTDEGRVSVLVAVAERDNALHILEEMDLTEFFSPGHE